MPKLRHIAFRTHDVEKTVAFYKEVFGLKQVGLGRIGVYLSDGYINLAVLNTNPAKRMLQSNSGLITLASLWKTFRRRSRSSSRAAQNRSRIWSVSSPPIQRILSLIMR